MNKAPHREPIQAASVDIGPTIPTVTAVVSCFCHVLPPFIIHSFPFYKTLPDEDPYVDPLQFVPEFERQVRILSFNIF